MDDAGGRTTDTVSATSLPPRLAVEPVRGFVGREAEMAGLRDAVAAAVAGAGPRVVLVAGEPGAGKTTLLAEIAKEAHAEGCTVVYGRGEEGLETPYGPWREALGRSAWPSGATGREQLFDALLDHVSASAAAGSLLLVLDDVQWADQASLLLLSHLVAVRPSPNLAILIAYRSTEVEAAPPMRSFLATVAREPGVARVTVPGLRPQDVAALVAIATARPLDDTGGRLADRLWADSGGNAFFVSALLDEIGDDSDLAASRSPTLREAIDHRVARLGEHAAPVLRAAAVVGEVFAPEIVAAAARHDEAEVLDIVERAVADRLVQEDPTGGFTFVHALVAEALLAGVSAARRRQLHRAIADALLTRDASPGSVALHLAAADPDDRIGRQEAVDAALSAGLEALDHFAYEDAVSRLAHVVALVERWDLDDGRRCSAWLALGRAESQAGSGEQAASSLGAALGLAARLGRWQDVIQAIYSFPFLPTATPDPALVTTLEYVASDAPGDQLVARALALSLLSWLVRYSLHDRRGPALAEEGAALADRTGDKRARVFARHLLLTSGIGSQPPPEQLALARATVDFIAGDDGFAEYQVRRVAVYELLAMGDLQGADEEVRHVRMLAERVRRTEIRFSLATWDAMRAQLEGRLDAAEEKVAVALTMGGVHGEAIQGVALMQSLTIAYLRGRLADFADVFPAVLRQFGFPAVRAILAAALAAAGRTTEAREHLATLAQADFADIPRDDVAASAGVFLAETCQALDARPEAEALYAWLGQYSGQCVVFPGVAAMNMGAVDRSMGQLAVVCGWTDVARTHLEDAARLNARLGARPFLALTRVEQAALGVPGAAEEARAIADELGIGLVLQRLDAMTPTPSTEGAELRAEGDVWTVTYAGRTVQLKGLRGFEYLRELLSRPGQEVHVVELQGGGDAGGAPVLDDKAKAAYRRRLEDLEAELEEAESFGDVERAARAAEGRQALAEELARAVGLGGRDREMGSDAERARLNVTRAIRAAMARIAEHHPELGKHLELAVRTGTYCAYEPDPALPVSWSV